MADVMKMVVGKGINPISKDSDKDGLMDMLDCKPYDPTKQGVIHNIGAAVARKVGREKLADKIEARGKERDEARAEVKQAGREAFQKERIVVAKRRGVARARGGTSFGSFVSEIRRTSPLRQATTSRGKGKKVTKFVSVKGKPGQFRKVTTRNGGIASQPKRRTVADVLDGNGPNIPKFF